MLMLWKQRRWGRFCEEKDFREKIVVVVPVWWFLSNSFRCLGTTTTARLVTWCDHRNCRLLFWEMFFAPGTRVVA